KDLQQATNGLSAGQWNFKPNFFRWSVAECLEHLALSEDLLFGFVDQAMKSPAQPPKDTTSAPQAEAALLKAVGDRSTKFTAPEPLRPTHHSSPQELLTKFAASRAHTIAFAKAAPNDIRDHCAKGPISPNCVNTYQWLLLIASHTERHLAQLLEVKADPKFPKQ
ncbi:MAG TPA: DinB family protein, partial [Blastocatellia bacterium]|nr:DinB family protein [Blastocatellia bacterium]